MSGDEGDSPEFPDDEFESSEGKSGTIFLIDARLSMFNRDVRDNDGNEKTKFHIALQCCKTFLMNKIISRRKDLVGVVLFGTDKTHPANNQKHITVLLELNYPSTEAVKTLDKLLSDEDSLDFQREYGFSDDFLLADALWCSNSLLSRSGNNVEHKGILLFTDDFDPHRGFPDRAHKARMRAKDLNKLKVSLELLPIGYDCDYNKFYKELVETVNGSTDSEPPSSSSKLEQLLMRVNRLDFKVHRYSKIKWNLGKGVCLGVSFYTLFREVKVASVSKLNRANNEPVNRVQEIFDQATGEALLRSDIVDYLNIAGTDIVFSKDEKDALCKIMEPGMNLLGFKPTSFASEALHIGEPSFAYPEETLVKGSKQLMKALVQRCASRDKVALCCLTPRHRARAKYVCLLPSLETYDEDGKMLTPCGFHVIPLPFDDSIRDQKFPKSPSVEPETVEIAKQLITKLRLSYKPSAFNNPKLQKFWAHLEALALDYDSPEHIEDSTIPDVERQKERLGDLNCKFNDACSLSGVQSQSSGAKRSYKPDTYNARSPKRFKDCLIQRIKDAIPEKKVEKFTVAELKEFLAKENHTIKPGMKKLDLVQAVYSCK